MMKTPRTRFSLLLALALSSGGVLAQSATNPLPEWDKLTPQQRETALMPLRDRWNNASPEERARMLEHAKRWQSMTPEQRKQARNGMHRFERMSPDQRRESRVLFFKMRNMSKDERKQLVAQWKAMSPAQRKAWIDKNAPSREEMPPLPLPPPRD